MKNLLLLVSIIISFLTKAQVKDLQLDLAKLEPGKTQVIQIVSAEYSGIRLKNKMVSAIYDIKYEIQDLIYDGFDPGGLNSATLTCNELKTQYDLLDAGEPTDQKHHEKDIPGIIKNINKILQKGECTNVDEIENATKLMDQTSNRLDFPSSISIQRGQQIFITVERNDGLMWIIYVKTRAVGNWKTLYGFTYVPEVLGSNRTFHTSPVASSDPTIYNIEEDPTTENFLTNVTPTIMFTWTPNSVKEKSWNKIWNNHVYKLGVVGGIFLDLEKPSAMIGPTVVFADNLSISSGIIFTERSRLKSKYSLGDEVGENLDFDQLHDTGLNTYKPELFFSIGFRFNENPFSKKEEDPEG